MAKKRDYWGKASNLRGYGTPFNIGRDGTWGLDVVPYQYGGVYSMLQLGDSTSIISQHPL